MPILKYSIFIYFSSTFHTLCNVFFLPSIQLLPWTFITFQNFHNPPHKSRDIHYIIVVDTQRSEWKRTAKKVSFLYNLHTFLDTSKGWAVEAFLQYFLLP